MPKKQSQRIRILTTGGTFDKRYGTDPWTVDLGFRELPYTDVLDILTRARVAPSYPVIPALFMPKDSTQIKSKQRHYIADRCAECPEDRIIIVHGTDTLLDHQKRGKDGKKKRKITLGTATVLGKRGIAKTIVLTGAAQPACMRDTDADFNLGVAIGAALFAPPGVYVAMNGQVFKWNTCRKNDHGFFVAK